jgi:hypothetical protein
MNAGVPVDRVCLDVTYPGKIDSERNYLKTKDILMNSALVC